MQSEIENMSGVNLIRINRTRRDESGFEEHHHSGSFSGYGASLALPAFQECPGEQQLNQMKQLYVSCYSHCSRILVRKKQKHNSLSMFSLNI